jgi:1-acyl-sn-glycerol-3-phosphate acyltransferase
MKTKINYAWRVFATGFCFLGFGLGSLFIGYLIFPMIRWVTPDKTLLIQRIQYVIHLSFKFFCGMMHHTGLIDYTFKGFDKLVKDQGVVFICNHPTLIDYVVIVSQLTQCNIIVKESLWKNRYMNQVIRSAGYIPNSQSDTLLGSVRDSLSTGNNLLIFPEGTRTKPSKPLKLQRGAAQLALRLPAKARMIRITTTESGLSKESKWYKVPKRKIDYRIEVGELLDPEYFLEKAGSPSLAARHLTRYFTEQLEKEVWHEQS